MDTKFVLHDPPELLAKLWPHYMYIACTVLMLSSPVWFLRTLQVSAKHSRLTADIPIAGLDFGEEDERRLAYMQGQARHIYQDGYRKVRKQRTTKSLLTLHRAAKGSE